MDRKLGYEIRKLNNLMHRKFMKEIKQSVGEDVTIIHAWILKYIIRMEPNDVFQKDIEHEFEISKFAPVVLKAVKPPAFTVAVISPML